jgi:hypothetical protein
VDVGAAIGVTRQHKVLLDYVAMELHTQTFATLGAVEQQTVREDAEEHYISYAFLRQSGLQHRNLKVDLQNDFTTGDNHCPKNRQQTLHLPEKYTKTVVPKTTQSKGTSFAQKGGRGSGNKGSGSNRNSGRGRGDGKKPFDKEYWKDKECYNCGEEGYPSSHCPKDDVDDNKSQAKSVKKLTKDVKSMKKAFTQLQKVKEADSDISNSEGSEADSHFQCKHDDFQFTQVEQEFEPQIAKLFKQAWTKRHVKLNLREIILLDSQSTMDLMCNCTLVTKTFSANKSMRLKSNGGTMVVTKMADMAGYHTPVW